MRLKDGKSFQFAGSSIVSSTVTEMSTLARDAVETTADERRGGKPWSLAARIVVSGLLLWHLTAILVGPFSLPPTLIGDRLQPIFRPYLGATYLDHGYKFFAPDPGPSHLIRYELEYADGTHRAGVFPNLDDQWPRLFYHRHFMLSEFINLAPPDPNWTPQMEWSQAPVSEGQKQYARSYADHLLAVNHAHRVTLWQREHLIPTPEQVAKGMRLDDPSLYRERKLGSFVEAP